MLSNLRRKRVQRLDINHFVKQGIWWSEDVCVGGNHVSSLGNQRYSTLESEKSFDYCRVKSKERNNLYPFYVVGNEIYNMILCSSGSFIKGSKDKDDKNQIAEKKIDKSFLLGETEITQELYQAVMNVENPSGFKGAKNPVEQVSWYDAVMFCNKLSDIFGLDKYYKIRNPELRYSTFSHQHELHYDVEPNKNSKGFRLPTEWEWEYAAKAGTQLKYSGSDDVNEVGWYSGNSNFRPHPVKQKKPNAWGFYDMSGNVREWCENKEKAKDTDIATSRAYRGGGCDWGAGSLNLTRRIFEQPIFRLCTIGFRVCRYV